MRNNRIRRFAVSTAVVLIAVGLGGVASASAVVAPQEATVDKASSAVVNGEVVSQEGVVTAPVVTDGKEGDVVTAFKVTDDVRTLPWVATAETVVVKGGVRVPAAEIGQGDRVSATGTLVKGRLASAREVVIHDAG